MSAPSPNSPTVPSAAPPTPSVSTPPSPVVPPAPVSTPPTPESSPPPAVSSPPPQSSPPPSQPSPQSPPPVVVTPSPPPITPPPVPTTPSPPPPVPSSPPPDTTTPSPVPVVSSPPPPAVPDAPPPSSSLPPSNAGSSPPPPSSAGSSPPPSNAGSSPPPSNAGSAPPPRRTSPSPPNEDPPPPPTASADPPTSSPTPPSTSPPSLSAPPPANNNKSSFVPALSPPNSVPGTVPSPPSGSGESPSGGSPPNISGGSPPSSFGESAPSDSTGSSDSGIPKTAVLGIAFGGLVAVILLVLLVVCCTRKSKKRGSSRYSSQDFRAGASYYKNESYYDPERRGRFDSGYSSTSDVNGKSPFPPMPPPSLGHAPTRGAQGANNSYFSYEELAQATNGFSRANMLGEGGFGCVYKGILSGGQEVAVKQLKVGGGQGEREFRAEVEIITRIHHRHLVTLVGYCISETQRLLVYEFVPNGTLEHHLHGKGRPLLDWSLRMKIAIGSARGLAYLHEDCHPKIIHRDIKSSNILLDSNFEAQVSDFGLAKLASDAHTHVTTRVMGTFGYLAPEYASSGKLTDKSDVYSFGVVLLELITGRKPVDTSQPLGEESLVEWSRPLINQAIETQDFSALADPMLNEYDKNEMLRMLQCAAACVRHSANKRPKMSQIVRALESESGPGFSGIHDSPFGSDDYDSAQYSSDLRRFRRMALGGTSQEYGSDYSGSTSEYGVNPSISSGEYQRSREYTSRNSHESEWPLRSRHT